MADVPVGSHIGHTVTDEVHGVEQGHIGSNRRSNNRTRLCCAVVGEIDAAALAVAKFLVFARCTLAGNALSIKCGSRLQRLGRNHIVQILVHVEVDDVLPYPLGATATHHHGRSIALRLLAATHLRHAAIDGRSAEACVFTIYEAQAVGDVGTRVLGQLGRADEFALDVIQIVVGSEQGSIGSAQIQACQIGREHSLEFIAHGQHIGIALLTAIGAIVEPLVGHIGMLQVDNRAKAHTCKHIVALVGSTHGLEHRLIGGVITCSTHQR